MADENVPVPPSGDELGSQLMRVAKPFALAGPLMAITLVPAIWYGQRSRDVAAEADRALVASLTAVDDGQTIELDPRALCEPTATERLTTGFTDLDLGADNHKASVTGLGFDTVTVDVKGRVDQPSGSDPDDITFRLRRVDDGWCVADVMTLSAGDG